MDAESRSRLGDLQSAVRKLGGREQLTVAECVELERLERELSLEQQEKADNPDTWFVNESSRPLLDGGNYNDTLKQMACDEVANFAKMLVARFGVPLAEAALQAGIAALKR